MADAREHADGDVERELNEEAERQAEMSRIPWSVVVVAVREDAEQSRELVPELNIVGLDDPRLSERLPSGPGSCVLALGTVPMRAAATLRGAGVDVVYGRHLPPACDYICQFLEQRAKATNYFGPSAHLREVFDAWANGAQRIDVEPAPHPELPRPPRLQGRLFQELLELPTPRTLIKGCLAELSVVVLGGASRTWKSFLVLDWHLSLFWGVPWRGRRVLAGSSVYFCGEGQAYAGRRVKAWLQKNAERIRDIDTGGRVFEIVGEVPALTKPYGIAELREYLRAFVRKHGPVSLVTFDTLSVAMSGDDDENNNPTLAAIVAELGRIRSEFGCTVVLVHHFRKDAGEGKPTMAWLRGGVALSSNADQVFLIQMVDGQQVLWLDKNKDGQDDLQVARSSFEVVTLGTDDEGLPITSGVLLPATLDPVAEREAKLATLVQHYREKFADEKFTQTNAEQMKPLDWGRGEVRELLAAARDAGLIRWQLEGKTLLHQVPGGVP